MYLAIFNIIITAYIYVVVEEKWYSVEWRHLHRLTGFLFTMIILSHFIIIMYYYYSVLVRVADLHNDIPIL